MDIDVVIELGGEDAKIIFLTGGLEERMNSTCAGGTGAFIDQMAALMNISTQELDEMSFSILRYIVLHLDAVFSLNQIYNLFLIKGHLKKILVQVFFRL